MTKSLPINKVEITFFTTATRDDLLPMQSLINKDFALPDRKFDWDVNRVSGETVAVPTPQSPRQNTTDLPDGVIIRSGSTRKAIERALKDPRIVLNNNPNLKGTYNIAETMRNAGLYSFTLRRSYTKLGTLEGAIKSALKQFEGWKEDQPMHDANGQPVPWRKGHLHGMGPSGVIDRAVGLLHE